MIGETLANNVARSISRRGAAPVASAAESLVAYTPFSLGRDALVRTANPAVKSGVTPKMAADLARIIDMDGSGQIGKLEGMVELRRPDAAPGSVPVSNYYGPDGIGTQTTPPVPNWAVEKLMGNGYSLEYKSRKTEPNLFQAFPGSADERASIAEAFTAVLAESPLAKQGARGTEIPVRYIKHPMLPLRKPIDEIQFWPLAKVRQAIGDRLADGNSWVKIDPLGQHPDGRFVLSVEDLRWL